MKKKFLVTAAAAAGAFVAPALLRGPEPVREPGRAVDLDDAVRQAKQTGLTGLELVAWCATLVHEQYALQTRRVPLERAETTFARRRGSSVQYNGALAELLRRAGLPADLVFAAQVRRGDRRPPWFATGHAWVRVEVDGRWRQVCARFGPFTRDDIVDGDLGVTPMTEVHRVRPVTVVNHAVVALGWSAWCQWQSILQDRPLPWWLEARF